MALIILIFVFYYVPESRDKLGIFPEKSLSEAIVKYGVEDDDDMVNLIDNIQKTVGLQVPERQLSNRQHQKTAGLRIRDRHFQKSVCPQILVWLTVMVLTESVCI